MQTTTTTQTCIRRKFLEFRSWGYWRANAREVDDLSVHTYHNRTGWALNIADGDSHCTILSKNMSFSIMQSPIGGRTHIHIFLSFGLITKNRTDDEQTVWESKLALKKSDEMTPPNGFKETGSSPSYLSSTQKWWWWANSLFWCVQLRSRSINRRRSLPRWKFSTSKGQDVVILSAGTSTHLQQLLTPGGPSKPNLQTQHDMIPQKKTAKLYTPKFTHQHRQAFLDGQLVWSWLGRHSAFESPWPFNILSSQTSFSAQTLKQLLLQHSPKVELPVMNYWGPQHHFERHTLS